MSEKIAEREIALYDFLCELRDELTDCATETGFHVSHSRESLAELLEELTKSLYVLLHALKTPEGSEQEEMVRSSFLIDYEKGVTLYFCVSYLEKFLEDNPDLDVDLGKRIEEKLEAIKNPEP